MPAIRGGSKSHPYRLPILVAAVAGAMLIPTQSALAQCVNPLRDGDFEQQRSRTVRTPWTSEGTAGIDIRRGLSRTGVNNAWARMSTGWNAIRQRVVLNAGTLYTLTGWIRTSTNLRAGYFGFRSTNQRPVSEISYAYVAGYRELRVRFRPTRSGTYYVFAGFWAPGQDAWIQIDSMRLGFPCDDVEVIPVEPE
jgi:hypothetical protein